MGFSDELGNRMKEYYENIPKTKLMRRCPVVLRIDGKSFHTFTRGFQKPFDFVLMNSMQQTMEYLCKNIQGCVFGYTQSDEITLILIDYQTLTTDAWFGYEVQKLCSVSASMATIAFNKFFTQNVDAYGSENIEDWDYGGTNRELSEDEKITLKYIEAYNKSLVNGAMFDSRCFNIPKEEVCNLIYWRQSDASRNSIQMVGRAYFSHSELKDKSCNDIQDMLMQTYSVNWNDFPTMCKRGSACIYKEGKWVVDTETPILKGTDRNYVNQYIFVGE